MKHLKEIMLYSVGIIGVIAGIAVCGMIIGTAYGIFVSMAKVAFHIWN